MTSIALFIAIIVAVFERCDTMDVSALMGLLLGLFGGGNIPGMGQHGLGTAINGSSGSANASYGTGFRQQASGLPALLLSFLGAGGGVANAANGTNGTNTRPQLPPIQLYAAGCGEFGIYLPGLAANKTKYGNSENKTFSIPSRFGPSAGHGGIAPIMPPNATFTIYKSGCGQFLLPNTQSLELSKNGSFKSGHVPTDKEGKKDKPGNKYGMGDGQQAPGFITQLLSLLGAMQGAGGMGASGGSGEHGPKNASNGPPAFLLPLLGLLGGAPNGTNQTTNGLQLPPFLMHASGCGEFGFYFPGLDLSRRNNKSFGKPNCANPNFGNGLREVFLDTHNNLRGMLAKGQTEKSQGWGIAPPASLMHRLACSHFAPLKHHGVRSMKKFQKYSCDAESYAQQEANTCGELPAHTHPGYKANHHFTSAANMHQAAQIAMQSWWGQLAQFGMRSNMLFQASEHQRGGRRVTKWSKVMAWWSNRYLGCAVRNCSGRFFVVCMYNPGYRPFEGNNVDGRVYPIGAVCSGCPPGKCDGQALCRM
ncbi:SCP-like protein [Ancylostoma caninum]|uniref:SCP-like protein n=1 Tax=Ancylostoma caninum TaxID=29170 RepID=A0A368FGN5_ANCCA|nr:SCP-like protein [Ancylostoma caninum]